MFTSLCVNIFLKFSTTDQVICKRYSITKENEEKNIKACILADNG